MVRQTDGIKGCEGNVVSSVFSVGLEPFVERGRGVVSRGGHGERGEQAACVADAVERGAHLLPGPSGVALLVKRVLR